MHFKKKVTLIPTKRAAGKKRKGEPKPKPSQISKKHRLSVCEWEN